MARCDRRQRRNDCRGDDELLAEPQDVRAGETVRRGERIDADAVASGDTPQRLAELDDMSLGCGGGSGENHEPSDCEQRRR